MRPKGEGETALDTLCRENGWTWGIVQTYQRKGLGSKPSTSTAVLIGVVVEGSAENIEYANDEAGAWRVVDQALGQVAEKLGG
jgi:hypothetical protein